MGKPPLLVIAGPTASGKSVLAIAKARRRGGVIINADASQLYVDIPILSAQPSAVDRAEVPHLLYGELPGAESCSAARWADMARRAIASTQAEGRLPILVGGTGLYLQSLLDGIAPVPPIASAVRAEVRALAPAAVRAALEVEDPAMASRLHPNDPQRNARALEVLRATGRSLLVWQQAPREGGLADRMALEALLLVAPRDLLAQRIDARFRAMMTAGALEEVRRLAAQDLPPGLPVMKALGVPPLLAHLRGLLPLEEAVATACRQTRAYAKRQRTWFESGGQSRGWLADATRLQAS
jgi:tRNA dimethylallyltransferase